jgi:phosphoenolpyruvate carboxylase
VQNEARRILERYKTIFKAFPMLIKFVKNLAKEAFWLFQAHQYSQKNPAFLQNFKKFFNHSEDSKSMRYEKLTAIKRTFHEMNIELPPPRIKVPIISFGTWKGGDRDGNPFVVASFTNLTFVEQKEFVLEQYIDITKNLLDKLTPGTDHVSCSKELVDVVKANSKLFPYLENVKPFEPYRAQIRYILEKLNNTIARVKEIKLRGGETVKPLLGLTIPGKSFVSIFFFFSFHSVTNSPFSLTS